MPHVVSRVWIKHEEQRQGESTHYCDKWFAEPGCDYKAIVRVTKKAAGHIASLVKSGHQIEDMYLDTKIVKDDN